MEEISEQDDLETRHRRERKDLQAKIQALKKSAPKNDKKKRKEIMEEVGKMEKELEIRHISEKLATQEVINEPEKEAVVEGNYIECTKNNQPEVAQRISKAQKRRDKKEQNARKLEEEVRNAAKEVQNAPKTLESNKIFNKLRDRDLNLVPIPSDGDCLYNAIRHQLQLLGLGHHSIEELRCETANYIHSNKKSLLPYMTNPTTGELLNDVEFEEYCNAVRSTSAWGGQVELKALSSVLKVPIQVLQAEGRPTIQGADEFDGPNLTITYHRHLYSLGEHYNSTMPATGEESN